MKKFLSATLIVILVFALFSCSKNEEPIPESFEFVLEWGPACKYDSESGMLTSDKYLAENYDGYEIEYFLSTSDKNKVRKLLNKCDLNSYPYELPTVEGIGADPNGDFRLTIISDSFCKIMKADVLLSEEAMYKGTQAEELFKSCLIITKMITDTDEWKSLNKSNYE